MIFDSRPTRGQQNHDTDLVTRQVLLITQVLICGNQRRKPFNFIGNQQSAIFDVAPPFFIGGFYGVIWEVMTQENRRALIE